MRKLEFLPTEDSEWIIPKEAIIAVGILDNFSTKRFLEVGVLNAAWSLNLLRNTDCCGVGIDPFLNLSQMRERTRIKLERHKYILLEKFEDLSILDLFDLIHIDGEHTFEGVSNDLKYSEKHLANRGVIAIDGVWHSSFPGVAAAFFSWLMNSDFAPFLVTGSKIYVTLKSNHSYWYKHFEEEFTHYPEFPWMHYYGEGKSLAYISKPDIGAYTTLLSPDKFVPQNLSSLLPIWPSQPFLGDVFQSCD